jgi:2-oxoglutarate ferredoxin oxidoreductase subunit alpha
MSGNEACGEGAVMAGCRFYAGYPITPQNELTEYMARRMPQVGGVFIQSESELAAINMVFGASLTGERAMTSSSSPGVSLKQEGISYLAGCELPAVIINMVRGGPGLGNIAPAQSDYFQATRGGGHGDYRTIVLGPSTVQEVMDLTMLAFELSDKYRTPAIILGDGLLGQMMEPVEVKSQGHLPVGKAGKVTRSQVKKQWALTGCKGRKPRFIKSLLLGEGELEAFNRKLQERYKIIEDKETRCETLHAADADVILIGYGSVARILKSAMAKLRMDGIKTGMIRPVTLWPFPYKIVSHLAKKAKRIVVVEMSEGQMVEDVRLSVMDDSKIKFYGRSGGGIPTEDEIINRVK